MRTTIKTVGSIAVSAGLVLTSRDDATLLPVRIQGRNDAAEPWRSLPWTLLIVAALLGQYVAMLLWLAGYKYTSASIASILNETASIFILLFAWIWLKKPLSRRKLAGVACTFGGVGVMLL